MKTIALLTKKGGAGKSSMATGLAAIAAGDGLRVAIIDLDPQASACLWADVRDADTTLPSVAVASVAPIRLPNELNKCTAGGVDLVVIDTAPSADSGLVAASKAADLCLLPSRPGLADLSALADTVELLSGRNAFTLLNAVQTKALSAEGTRALKGLDLPVCPVIIWQRIAWGHAFSMGMSVAEYDSSGKASAELQQLWKWIKKELEI